MSTTIRVHGTHVTESKDGLERIEAARKIVERKQYAKIDGIMVDLFSASAIVAVYDALNDKNKEMYLKLSISSMAKVAFRYIK